MWCCEGMTGHHGRHRAGLSLLQGLLSPFCSKGKELYGWCVAFCGVGLWLCGSWGSHWGENRVLGWLWLTHVVTFLGGNVFSGSGLAILIWRGHWFVPERKMYPRTNGDWNVSRTGSWNHSLPQRSAFHPHPPSVWRRWRRFKSHMLIPLHSW